jgi:F-type H+-transporting ATPase subunit epsilon
MSETGYADTPDTTAAGTAAADGRLRLEILTIERQLFDEQVDMVIAPGADGMVGILPHHQPMLTALQHGELTIQVDGEADRHLAIGGGIMQVLPDHVVVLADHAEHADEIDLALAEQAHQRALELMEHGPDDLELGHARDALRHSAVRLAVARRHHGRMPR